MQHELAKLRAGMRTVTLRKQFIRPIRGCTFLHLLAQMASFKLSFYHFITFLVFLFYRNGFASLVILRCGNAVKGRQYFNQSRLDAFPAISFHHWPRCELTDGHHLSSSDGIVQCR